MPTAASRHHARARAARPARAPATWWSPTTPRRCRRASRGMHLRERRADRGAPGRPALARASTTCASSAPSSSAPATTARAPKTGRCRRRCAPATRSRSARCARRCCASLGHPRLVELRFDGTPDAIWAGIARHGRPVQYAHLAEPLALWDVWTRDRRAAGRLRAAVGRLRARLAAARRAAPARHRLRDADPCRRPVVDRRSRRSTRACRSTSPITCRQRPSPRSQPRTARGGRIVAHRHDRRARPRARRGPRRRPARRRRHRHQRLGARDAACASSTCSSAARTSRARATTSCCAPSSATRRCARIDAALEARGYRTHEFGDSVLDRARRAAQPRSNLNTATLASRFGQVRTTLPA